MSPGRESRPAANRAASNVVDGDTPIMPRHGRTAALARRRWALQLVSRCQNPAPAYGSPEWLALPEGSAEKVAAVVRAAECWATDTDNAAENLRVELEAAARAAKALEDEQYAARRDDHRAQWGGLRLVRGAYADTEEFRGGRSA